MNIVFIDTLVLLEKVLKCNIDTLLDILHINWYYYEIIVILILELNSMYVIVFLIVHSRITGQSVHYYRNGKIIDQWKP